MILFIINLQTKCCQTHRHEIAMPDLHLYCLHHEYTNLLKYYVSCLAYTLNKIHNYSADQTRWVEKLSPLVEIMFAFGGEIDTHESLALVGMDLNWSTIKWIRRLCKWVIPTRLTIEHAAGGLEYAWCTSYRICTLRIHSNWTVGCSFYHG